MMTYTEAYKKLERFDQLHVLKFYDELSPQEKEELLRQIDETDFSVITSAKASGSEKGKISPISVLQLDGIEERRSSFEKTGAELIRQGKVGAVLLAGGMGTRLGSDNPKGMYNIGITRELFIFECLINNLLDVVRKVGAPIKLFIMTSDKNHEATVAFFEEKNYFGYDKTQVHFFMQDMAPATDFDGKVFMETKSRMATSPNGNGGWFSSMKRGGLLTVINEAGIEWLNVFAVDNVLQRIADPCFIGAAAEGGYAVGSKVIKKASPDERVGVMCLEDGRPSIVEYYELSDEMRDQLDENGEPAYNYGVILNYLFREKDLEALAERTLPLHIVKKKINHIDADGNAVIPEAENGFKYENLVLDMINMLESCIPFEVVREHEFAPVKNRTGVDSVDSARELLKRNGVEL